MNILFLEAIELSLETISDSDKACGRFNGFLFSIELGIIDEEKLYKSLYPNSFSIDFMSSGDGPMCLRTKLSG